MENTFTCQVHKVGGSLMITIPKTNATLLKVKEGMTVEVTVKTDKKA